MSYSPKFVIDFEPALPERDQIPLLEKLIEELVEIDEQYLQSHSDAPALAVSGVCYSRETFERRDVGAMLCTLRGDAPDFCAWQAAELRLQGERAGVELLLCEARNSGARIFSVAVRRADGSLEYPWENLSHQP